MNETATSRLQLAAKQVYHLDRERARVAVSGRMLDKRRADEDLRLALPRLETETHIAMRSGAYGCVYCHKAIEGGPGGYYHAKSCEASYLRSWLEDRPGNAAEQRMLEESLSRSKYVGD